MKKLCFFFFGVLLTTSISAQDNIVPRKLGIGLNLTQLRLSDLYSYNLYSAPANSVMIEVSPLKSLRVTPSIGYFSRSVEIMGPDSQRYDEKQGLFAAGLGLFYMFQKQDVNFYTGMRFEMARIQEVFYDFDYVFNPNPPYDDYYVAIEKESINTRTSYNPTLGAEYFFSPHFSIGGEFQLRISTFEKTKQAFPSPADGEKMSISTDAGIQLRFYF